MLEKIGHYEIISQLGRGGMGVVYKAHEPSLNRTVAVKLLGEHLSEDKEFVQRFKREAQAAAALNHPNIVQIYSFGEDEGRYYFAMEYVDGISAQEMIQKDGQLNADQAAHIVMQAAEGLAVAHDSGMIHRDIKPANLMINRKGLVKITDFGIAMRPSEQTRLTASGMLMGTPGYLSPEQCLGRDVDSRTDIYALGVSLYEMITGKVPFNADSPAALIREIVDGPPLDLSVMESDYPGELLRIVQKMMDRDPDKRYQDCHEIASDLSVFLSERGNIQAPLISASPPRGTAVVNGKKTTPIARSPEAGKPSYEPAKKSPPILLIVIIVFVAIALLAGGGFIVMKTGLLNRMEKTEAAIVSAQESPSENGSEEKEIKQATDSVEETEPEPAQEAPEPVKGQKSATRSQPALQKAEPTPEIKPSRTQVTKQLAEVKPSPPSVPPPPAVMVVFLGDTLLGNPLTQILETNLESQGVVLKDTYGYPDVQRQMTDAQQGRGGETDILSVMSPVSSTAVIARIQLVGERRLEYYGQYDTAWTADVVITVYDTVTGLPQGRGCRKRIEYTTVGVEAKIEYEMKDCIETVVSQASSHIASR